MRGVVSGIILDSSVLLLDPENEEPSMKPAVESLFRKLRHSKIRTGVSYGAGLSTHKVNLFKKMATLYSFDCFILNESSLDDSIKDIMVSWGDNGGNILYLTSNYNEDTCLKLRNCGSLVIVQNLETGAACEASSVISISKLDELPLTVCQLNKKVIGKDLATVAYVMKPSREEDFAKRGAFPLYPTQNGLVFVPLMLEFPLSPQLKEVDVILHKATDEVTSIELSNSSDLYDRITYTKGMQELKRFMEHHPDLCVIDPLEKISSVLDRLKIQHILVGLKDLNFEGGRIIRAPNFLKVGNFKDNDLVHCLSEAKLYLPSIVKPQVACGVPDAHSMAIVYRVEDFNDLNIPLPAIVQEYVDHSSTLYKIYVLGEQVFYSVKKSIPNTDILMKLSESTGPLLFDSLKSLPIAKDTQHSGGGVCSLPADQCFDLEMVTHAAKWLMRKMDLTIFGFDVVVQEGSGDHVIVDVNYLPSFKEVPDEIAIPAFWRAIKYKFEKFKQN